MLGATAADYPVPLRSAEAIDNFGRRGSFRHDAWRRLTSYAIYAQALQRKAEESGRLHKHSEAKTH